jgi:lipoate-protein ligase A
MKFLDITFDTPQENLACDEALLCMCQAGFDEEILRFWEARQHFVVLGYSSRVHSAVHLQYCLQNNIPVLRRYSGGGTVVQGPGCANYTVILRIPESGPLQTIRGTNNHIMTPHKIALEPVVGTTIEVQGSSDLALGSLKFSGNAQRRTDRHVLFHGTFLLDFGLSIVQKVLPLPSKQPSYRRNRSHEEFLTNVHIQREVLKRSLRKAWSATEELEAVPAEAIRELARTRYSTKEWTFRF